MSIISSRPATPGVAGSLLSPGAYVSVTHDFLVNPATTRVAVVHPDGRFEVVYYDVHRFSANLGLLIDTCDALGIEVKYE